jgi:dephospho-CoA kinase
LALTGPPAVGKTTAGRPLAASRRQGAYVDVDDIRQLVVAGHAAPWEFERLHAEDAAAQLDVDTELDTADLPLRRLVDELAATWSARRPSARS